MNRLIAVLALLAAAPAMAGNPEAGKEKSAPCAACHGPEGKNPPGSDFPRLAGQYYDYLVQAMKDYQTGVRNNPIMRPQVANLSEQDLEDLAAYYAHQEGLTVKY